MLDDPAPMTPPPLPSTYQPEQLSLWDRLFNRYRKVIVGKGQETWFKNYSGPVPLRIPDSQFSRDYVEYHIIDRLTGSVTLKKQYLN